MNKQKDLYLGQETLESVEQWIRLQLNNGATVFRIVESMTGTTRGDIVISKWDGSSASSMSYDEQFQTIKEYIHLTCKSEVRVSGLSDEVREIMLTSYVGMDFDEYADFLTNLMNSKGYQKISTHITSILASFKPYMIKRFPHKFEKLSEEDIEVELLRFIKKHLVECLANNVKGEPRAN